MHIGIFFVNGYLARLVRNVVEGLERPLPEWTDLGDMFAEGAMLFVAALLYMIPLFFLVFLMFPFSVLTNIDNPATQILGGGVLVILSIVLMPVGLAVAVWVPAALLHAVVRRDFRAAFEFRVIGTFLRNNALNYVLAYLDWIVARMAAPLGLALCASVSSTITSRAVRSCSGEWVKMAERYCVPTSAPWRFSVVGSWMAKKTLSRSRYESTAGSKVTLASTGSTGSPSGSSATASRGGASRCGTCRCRSAPAARPSTAARWPGFWRRACCRG